MGKNIPHSLVISMAIFFASNALTAHAEVRSSREYQIKAAFLYNFAKFVEWPADRFAEESDPLILCVIGEDPFGNILDETIKGKNIRGRELEIIRLKEVDDLKSCHFLYISTSEQRSLPQIIESIGKASVLTVGEMQDFAELGGIINLITRGNKVRFKINVDVANQAGLKISSRLLRLATVVIRSG